MIDSDSSRREQEDTVYRIAQYIQPSKEEKRPTGAFPELGLCNHCQNLRGVVTEFGLRCASCFHHVTKLDGRQRILKCSLFWDSNYKSIHELMDYHPEFIDPKKERVGF